MKIQFHAILSLCCLPSLASATPAEAPRGEAGVVPEARVPRVAERGEWRLPNRLLVSWRSDASATEKLAARAFARAASTRDLTTPAMRTFGAGELEAFELPLLADLDAVAAELRRQPGIRAVDFDVLARPANVSNDPFVVGGQSWGVLGDTTTPMNAHGSQAMEAWGRGLTGGSNVYVGVIDTGVDVNHPDLVQNIWQNPHDPIDGVDNDGNGRIDDRNGWDFVNNDRTVYDGSPSNLWRDEHGTHVAGILGARGGNGIGVAGVAWTTKIITGKVIDDGSGPISGVALALDYMIDLKTRHGLNIAAINLSLGYPVYTQVVRDALVRARLADIVVVVAAGNGGADNVGDNLDLVPYYPASHAANLGNMIAVANITSVGGIASSSNFGPRAVSIGAPGTNILSTLPQNRYGYDSGTSMAAPFVTGAVLLWRASRPADSAATTRASILVKRIPTPSLSGKVSTGGRLDLSTF